MTAAIFGLIGVIIGGLITSGVELFRDSFRERRGLRSAVRLVDDELGYVVAALDNVLEVGKWRPQQDDLERSAWEESKPLLAAALELNDWRGIVIAYLHMDNFVAQSQVAEMRGDQEFANGEEELLRERLDAIENVQKRLNQLETELGRSPFRARLHGSRRAWRARFSRK
jgi:hypothetical protein